MIRVKIKHSIVIDYNGLILRYGKGAIVEVPDRVYVDNWTMMERLDEVLYDPPKVERLITPRAKPYRETASLKSKSNAAMKKPVRK